MKILVVLVCTLSVVFIVPQAANACSCYFPECPAPFPTLIDKDVRTKIPGTNPRYFILKSQIKT